jgi:hypothetical protein
VKQFDDAENVLNLIGCQKDILLISGRAGTIYRKLLSDHGAWVIMDENLPSGAESFDYADNRARHVLLYPEQCDEIVDEKS